MLAAPTADTRSDAKVTGLITAGHFFSHLYILTLPPLFPLLHDELGLSMTALGLLIAVLNVTTLVCQPPIGMLVDRVGPSTILIAGHMAFAIAIGLVGFFSAYPALLALMVLAGIGNAVYHPADYSILAARVSPERMGRAFSVHTFGGYLGFAAAPVSMVTLTELFGWRAALVVVGLAGVATGLVLFAMRSDFATTDAHTSGSKARGKADLSLYLSPPVLLSLLFFFLLAMAHTGVTSFGAVVLVRLYDLGLVEANTPIAAYLFVSTAGVLVGGWLADKLRHHALVVGISSLVIGVAAAAIVLFLPGYSVLVALFVVAGFASGVIAPSRDMLVRAVTPKGASGSVFGFVMVGFNIGGLLAPPIYGLLVDHGMPHLVFWSVALFSVLTLVTLLGTAAGRRPQTAQAQA